LCARPKAALRMGPSSNDNRNQPAVISLCRLANEHSGLAGVGFCYWTGNRASRRKDGAMFESIRRLLSEDNFMPHGMCYLWQPGVLGLHVVSDALITLAYFAISFMLAYFVHQRKDLQFPWMFICFAVFIVACGGTHLMEVWVIWHPTYWLSGSIKALTALASVPTAILLVKLIPQVLQLPSPSALRNSYAELEREIAERARAESAVRRLNERLEERVAERTRELEAANRILRETRLAAMQQERLRALGQMASGIAHDINNALAPAALNSRLLLERDGRLSDDTRDCLADICRSVGDVMHTVARLTDFYRAREPQFLPAPVQLNRLLHQVVDLTHARWHDMPQERGFVVNIEMSVGADLPPILGVESEIRDALMNLILNAVDAMPEGGTLTLRLYTVTQPSVELNESEEHQETGGRAGARPLARVRVDVCDTGVGMTEEIQRKCLQPLYTTKGERGTGLGLAMVYGMVQRHRAEIEIQSEPRKGSTMSLIFPVAAATSSSAAQHTTPLPAAQSLRVLVVDDDPGVSKSLRRVLEADGHRVTVADGGQAGIDTFVAAAQLGEPFALVLADMGMPYVDGRKVAAAIKTKSPITPIVLVTGWGQNISTPGELPLHVDRVLGKPPDVDELRRAIVELTVEAAI
jgi:signal transduction histidine kinase/CheY-like chemotaxis protein